MGEYRIKQNINLFEIVDEYTKRISRVIDEQTLANVENQLAEFGYVKVVRCMDCKWFTNSSHYGAYCTNFGAPLHDDYDGFCAWGERKVDA